MQFHEITNSQFQNFFLWQVSIFVNSSICDFYLNLCKNQWKTWIKPWKKEKCLDENMWQCAYVPQIREQKSGPDLHVFTLKCLALKKLVFTPNTFQFFFFLTFVYLYSMQLFSADAIVFSIFFLPRKSEKTSFF